MEDTLMFGKILVAYDGSTPGSPALRQGAELAKLCKTELHLLGIVVTTGFMALAEGTGSIDVWGLERKSLQKALDAAVEHLAEQGVKVVPTIREGDPEVQISAHAHEIKADLVVIGHSGKGFIARWLEGSVGTELVNHLPCSVLIATDPA
jgi:nucleotide-binding universal stress UspA family protein